MIGSCTAADWRNRPSAWAYSCTSTMAQRTLPTVLPGCPASKTATGPGQSRLATGWRPGCYSRACLGGRAGAASSRCRWEGAAAAESCSAREQAKSDAVTLTTGGQEASPTVAFAFGRATAALRSRRGGSSPGQSATTPQAAHGSGSCNINAPPRAALTSTRLAGCGATTGVSRRAAPRSRAISLWEAMARAAFHQEVREGEDSCHGALGTCTGCC